MAFTADVTKLADVESAVHETVAAFGRLDIVVNNAGWTHRNKSLLEVRLARALLLLANFGKESRPEPVIAKVSQETLAELIGTTRSRRRADIDDRPATMPLHDRHNKVRHQIDRLDVDGKNAIELQPRSRRATSRLYRRE